MIIMMITHWPLTGNTNDYSGLLNNGISYNVTYDSYGKIGTAGSFNGTNAYVKVTNNPTEGLSALTIAGWIKPTAGGSNYRCALHKGADSSVGGTEFWFGISAGGFITATIGARLGLGWAAGETTTTAVMDTWYHVAASWDGSTVRVYINGNLQKSYSLNNTLSLATPIRMGSSSDGVDYLYSGLINDVRIYDRGLSEYEIKEIAKAKILHYNFNNSYEEPTYNLAAPAITPIYSKWGTNTGTTTNTTLDGKNVTYLNITSFTDGGVGWYSQNWVDPSTASAVYTVSAKIKFSGSGNPSANLFYLRQYNGGSQLSEFGIYSAANMIPLGNGWYQAWATFTTNASSNKFSIQGYEYKAYQIWIYDLQIEKKENYTPFIKGQTSRNLGVSDISGYKYTGIASEDTSPFWTSSSKLGSNGLFFSDTISQNISTTLVSPRDQITMSTWFKSTSSGFGTFHIPMGSSSLYYEISIGTGGSIRTGLHIAGTRRVYDSGSGLLNGAWHHLALTFDGTTMKAYIDGNETGSWSHVGTLNGGNLTWYVGYYPGYGNKNAYQDDYRIYSTALSGIEIKSLYERRANFDNFGNVQANQLNNDPNLISNPSFDLDTTGTKTPIGFTAEVNGNTQIVDIDSRRAILFPGDGVYRRIRSTEYFPVTAGQTIYAKAYVKRMTGVSFYYGLYWNTGSYNYFTSGGSDNTWTMVGGSLVVPAGVTSAALWMFNYSGNTGALYADDVYISYDPIPDNYAEFMDRNFYIVKYDITGSGDIFTLDIDEISGTMNSLDQQEVTKTGTLLINGEFSEVD